VTSDCLDSSQEIERQVGEVKAVASLLINPSLRGVRWPAAPPSRLIHPPHLAFESRDAPG